MEKLSIAAGTVFFFPFIFIAVHALVRRCLGWRG